MIDRDAKRFIQAFAQLLHKSGRKIQAEEVLRDLATMEYLSDKHGRIVMPYPHSSIHQQLKETP